MSVPLLRASELKKLETVLPEWKLVSNNAKLVRTIPLSRYIDGLVVLARIAVIAEVVGHHPDCTYSYTQLRIVVTTHDQAGLTKKDIALAQRIEEVLKRI